MPGELTGDQSTLVQAIFATNGQPEYLKQRSPRSLTPYGVNKTQWTNSLFDVFTGSQRYQIGACCKRAIKDMMYVRPLEKCIYIWRRLGGTLNFDYPIIIWYYYLPHCLKLYKNWECEWVNMQKDVTDNIMVFLSATEINIAEKQQWFMYYGLPDMPLY